MAKKRSTATRRAESQAAAARAAAIRKEQERKERRRRSLIVTGGRASSLLALVVLIGYLVEPSRDTTGRRPPLRAGAVGGLRRAGRTELRAGEGGGLRGLHVPVLRAVRGRQRATVAEDADQGKVQIAVPRRSTSSTTSSTTTYSTRAANASPWCSTRPARTVAKKFHDLLFENQPAEGSAGLSDSQLVDLAVQAGAKRSAVQPGIERRGRSSVGRNVTDQASKAGVTAHAHGARRRQDPAADEHRRPGHARSDGGRRGSGSPPGSLPGRHASWPPATAALAVRRLRRRPAQGRAARAPRRARPRRGSSPSSPRGTRARCPSDLDELRDFYTFRDFAHFIEVYLAVVDLLREPEDIRLLTYEVATDMAAQNIRYAELT